MPATVDRAACAGAAPRDVPLSLLFSAMFGGKVVQMSWAMLLIALVPIWYCVQDKSFDPVGTFALWGPTKQVRGYVSSVNVVHETDMGDGGVGEAFGVEVDHTIRQSISKIRYTYPGPDGTTHTGEAQVRRGDEYYCDEGTPVTVVYSTYNPAVSRVEGLRPNWGTKATWVMIGFWLFAVGSLWFVYPIGHGVSRGLRARRLLPHGRVVQGRFCGGRDVKPLKIYHATELSHSFRADGKDYTVARLRVDDIKTPPADVEPVFYDESNPSDAMALSDIPGGATIDGAGAVREDRGNGYNALCLPMVCLFAWMWFALNMLGVAPAPSLSMLS